MKKTIFTTLLTVSFVSVLFLTGYGQASEQIKNQNSKSGITVRSNTKLESKYDKLIERGNLLLKKSEYDSALQDFDKAIELDADDARGFVGRGMVRLETEDFDGAIADFNEAFKLAPNTDELKSSFSKLYVSYGIYCLTQNNHDKAREYFQKANEFGNIGIPEDMHDAVVEKLLEGASDNAKSWWKAFENANTHNNKIIAELLNELVIRGATINDFYDAYVVSKATNTADILSFMEMNTKNENGTTSLFTAIKSSNLDTVEDQVKNEKSGILFKARIADIQTWLDAGDKLAELTDFEEEWSAARKEFEFLEGFNLRKTTTFYVLKDGTPLLFLPIDAFKAMPGAEFWESAGKGKYLLDVNDMEVYAIKIKGGYVITLNESEDQRDIYEEVASTNDAIDDALAELASKHNIKFLLDSDFYEQLVDDENVDNFSEIVKKLAHIQGTQFEDAFDTWFGVLFQALSSNMLLFAPQSGDIDFVLTESCDVDSEYIDQIKNAKTIFGGFRFPDKETVLTGNLVDFTDADDLELEEIFFGEVFQSVVTAEMELLENTVHKGDEEAQEFMSAWVKDWTKFWTTLCIQERTDIACTLSSDGIFLAGAAVSDTDKLENPFSNTLDFLRKKHGDSDFDGMVKKYWKKNIVTVNGFKISGFSISVRELGENMPLSLQEKKLTVYYAVKKDQAVAFVAGFSEKTEEIFFKALRATNTRVDVADNFTVSLRPLGKLLKNFDNDALAYAEPDAQFTVSMDHSEEKARVYFKITGNFIKAIARLIKTHNE
ncbi:MAG: hypothetical protein LBJ67_03210 [Planctomycetaceae bacterium]|jgi:tetratricopeptide (TPR) repeat protein|nr:hypothetical protein [Planctomycetaceae bacterium]